MPFEGEHACRIEDPDRFDEFRRVTGEGRAPDQIVGILDDGSSVAQSLRFSTKDFDEEQARKLCHERGGTFEPAESDEPSDGDGREQGEQGESVKRLLQSESLAVEPERRELQGREYLVVPAIGLREMVIDGEFISEEALQESVDNGKWDGRPLTLGHNTDEDGSWQSATDTEFADERQIGSTRNSEVEDGKLRTEAWIDLELANRTDLGRQVVDKVESGDLPIEVSSAYEARLEPKEGKFNDTRFQARQHHIVPDHLAVLPGQTGKCSVEDGCGLGRMHVRDSPRRPTFDGTESSEWSTPDLQDYVSGLGLEPAGDADEINSIDDLSQEDRSAIAQTSLLGEADAETFDELVFFPVVDPSTNNLNENALRAVITGRGAQADIPDNTRSNAQSTARELLNDEFDADLETEGNVDDAGEMDRDTARNALVDLFRRAFGTEDDADTDDADTDEPSLRDRLELAVETEFGGDGIEVELADVREEKQALVFERSEGDESGHYLVDFAANDEEGTLELGEPVEVKRMTTFEPVDDTDDDEETTMENRDDLIDKLVDLEDAPFGREQLEAMEDSQLKVVARGQGVLEDDADTDDDADEPEGDDAPKAQADDDEPEGDDADDAEIQLADLSEEDRETLSRLLEDGETLTDLLDRFDRLESLLDEAEEKANAREEKKEQLVETLSDRETVSLSEDDLEALSLEGLEELERNTDPDQNFVARGSRAHRRRNREGRSYLDENPRTPNVLLGGSDDSDD